MSDAATDDDGLQRKVAQILARLTTAQHWSEADMSWLVLEIMAEQAASGIASTAEALGRHFAQAIKSAKRDPDALMRHLGLMQSQGRKPIGLQSLMWGAVVCSVEDAGAPPEMALDAVASALARAGQDLVDRTTLQRWRDAARDKLRNISARK